MSFPRYPEYKDSGVEWLGEVPGHWTVTPLKYVARFRSGGTPSKDRHAYWEGSIPWASSKDMKSEALSETIDHITELAIEEGAAALLPAGTVVVVVRGMILARAFPVALTEAEISINQDLKALEATGNVLAAFLAWYLRGTSDESLRRLDEAAHGTKALRMEAWASLPVSFPDIEEQVQIAAFLDRETAKIDALVAEQQNLIALLKENRQALISHAVTKGLDPDVPMKDSGVAWLGEVPAHWSVGKTGYYLAIVAGFAFSSAEFALEQSDARLLRGVNVGVGRIKWEEVVYWKRVVGDGLEPYELKVDDLVIGLDRPLITEGVRIARISEADLPCLLLQRVAALHPRPSMHSAYIYYLLASDMFVAHFAPETTGVSVPHISPDQIGQFVIPIPPLPEQAEITAQIISESEKIEVLMCEAKASIELLQERRTALISAAVTGKIDVRRLAVAAADRTPEPA